MPNHIREIEELRDKYGEAWIDHVSLAYAKMLLKDEELYLADQIKDTIASGELVPFDN